MVKVNLSSESLQEVLLDLSIIGLSLLLFVRDVIMTAFLSQWLDRLLFIIILDQTSHRVIYPLSRVHGISVVISIWELHLWVMFSFHGCCHFDPSAHPRLFDLGAPILI